MAIIKQEKYVPNPLYQNFIITANGNMWDLFNNQFPKLDSLNQVTVIDNNLTPRSIPIERLYCQTFIGIENFPIIRKKRGRNSFNELSYAIESFVKYSNEEYFINDQLFKQIPNFNDFLISSNGTVYSLFTNNFIRKSYNYRYYQTVTIQNVKKKRTPQKIHRLVFSAYSKDELPLQNSGLVIDHIDNNNLNNKINNLQILSYKDNIQKSYVDGNHMIWHYKDYPDKIVKLINLGFNLYDICNKLDLDYDTHQFQLRYMILSLINNNNAELNNRPKIIEYYGTGKFSRDDYIKIANLKANKIPVSSISRLFNCSDEIIYKIEATDAYQKIVNGE